MYVEEFVSGELEVEAAPQSHLPQFLGSLVSVETVVAQEEANYKKKKQAAKCTLGWKIRLCLLIYSSEEKVIVSTSAL